MRSTTDPRNPRRRTLLRATLAAVAPVPLGARAAADRFHFALVGDTPYDVEERTHLRRILQHLGELAPACVIHVGDLKGGSQPCSDALLRERLALLDASPRPLVLTPGDNDWTDCARPAAGSHDPLERLAFLRRVFFADGRSLGRERLALERQLRSDAGYALPENARWRIGNLRFMTAHVVGSDDGRGGASHPSPEWSQRSRATRDWLRETTTLALDEGASGLVVAFHADPEFRRGVAASARDAHAPWRRALSETARRFRRPILLAHGDSHLFRVDQPLADENGRRFPQVTRVIAYGSPMSSYWVRVAWDATRPDPFVVSFDRLPS